MLASLYHVLKKNAVGRIVQCMMSLNGGGVSNAG